MFREKAGILGFKYLCPSENENVDQKRICSNIVKKTSNYIVIDVVHSVDLVGLTTLTPHKIQSCTRAGKESSPETEPTATTMETQFGDPDVYGQRHPIETPELIEYRLNELKNLLINGHSSWQLATTHCPALVDDAFLLMFLRARKFDAASAAERIERYWTQRVELFGMDKAFLPLTLNGALKDDSVALNMGMIVPTNTNDSIGRAIVVVDPSRQDKSRYTRESMARAFWYVLHSVLEDESAQQKGVIFINYAKNVRFGQFDRGLISLIAPSISGSLPLRFASMHVCNPPSFFSVIFPIISFFLGNKLRKRVQLHRGEDIAGQLVGSLDLSREVLPDLIGGSVSVDLEAWLEQRKKESQ